MPIYSHRHSANHSAIDICNFSTRINLNSCDNYFTFFAGYAYVHMYTCILDAKPLKL